jgi:selT/selW/selH-like putative selenoprotein
MVRVEINIEICSNCKEHAWCTRHNEATYLSLAEELQKSIKNQRESAIVNILKVGGHKMGSFEVSCNGVALFSKLALGYFPHTALLTNRIMQFIDDSEHGKDLAKYRHNLSPMKYNPNFKQSSSQSPEKNPSNPNLPAHNEEKPKQEEAKRENKSSIVNVQKPSNTSVKV